MARRGLWRASVACSPLRSQGPGEPAQERQIATGGHVPARRVLSSLRSLQAAEAALKGVPAPERCFPCQQVEGHWREHVWRAVLRRAELRYPKIHTLRHTVASLLLARGESLAYVSEQLGHSRPASTLKVYTHLVPREGHRAVDGLDTLGQEHASPAQATALILRDMESLVYRG